MYVNASLRGGYAQRFRGSAAGYPSLPDPHALLSKKGLFLKVTEFEKGKKVENPCSKQRTITKQIFIILHYDKNISPSFIY